VTHQAWNPYYFEYMNSKNYEQLDKEFLLIFKLTIIVAFGVACFGKEIGYLLVNNDFSVSLYLVPIFTIGYIFSQLSFTFIRNFGYTKKTQFMSITILFSGICNIFLNLFLIKYLGELGAAISFVLSYIIMAIFAWFINAYYIKLHTTPVMKLLAPIFITIPFYIVLFYIMNLNSFFMSLILKLLIFILFTILLLWGYRTFIYRFYINISKKLFYYDRY
jgi:O-antigen/teichoic acid export membrane protein